MSTLYVSDNKAEITVSGGYYCVNQADGLVRKIPKETLEAITILGNASLTIPCMKECLKQGIPVNLFSGRGSYFGKLSSTRHTNVSRLKKQVYASDDKTFCMEMAKRIIEAKINNQRVVLRRYNRTNIEDVGLQIRDMTILRDKVISCKTIEELMGYEGLAARYYFSALSKLVNPEFSFSGRNKRPPKDPFNSMISLGYTILLYKIYAEVENRGLSPYIGIMHGEHVKHPALACDLMEEWRAVIVDSTVMSLIQGKEIHPEHFEKDEERGGVIINKAGMKIFLDKLENKFRTYSKYLTDEKCSMNYAIYLQSVDYLRAIEDRNPDMYHPVKIR